MMDYCKRKQIPPAQKWAWDEENKKYNEHQENLNISDISDSEIIIGNYYYIMKFNTKVVVVDKNDKEKKVFVTADLVDKTGEFWINYNKLSKLKDGKIF